MKTTKNVKLKKSAALNLIIKTVSIGIFCSTFSLSLAVNAQTNQPCDADSAVQAFQTSVDSVLRQLPALDQEIDYCFNLIDYPQHATAARQNLRAVSAEYKSSIETLEKAYDSLKTGQDAEFSRTVTTLVTRVTQASKPLFDGASQLTRHGFTTSDRKDGKGQYRYPNCNSQKNNRPDRQWASVFQDVKKVQSATKSLQAVLACLGR